MGEEVGTVEVEIEEEAPVEVNLEEEEEKREAGGHEPPPTHPRFKDVYGKMKTYERELEATRASMKEEREAARAHNQKLVEAIENMSKKTVESLEAKDAKETTTSQLTYLNNALSELEDQKAEYLKDGDYKSSVKIDREIRKVERAIEGVAAGPPRKRETAPSGPPPPDPDIEEFVTKVKWFDQDPLMTGAAKELDYKLSQDPKWKGEPLKKRLAEVRRVIEDKFSWKGTKPGGTESGLNQPGGKLGDGSTRIRLSAEEVAAAKGMGLTPAEYAHQLVLMGGRK